MDTALGLPVLIGLIAVALLFDFLNGLHDAANSIATIVSTRVLRPQYAVFWAAFFNFVAFAVFGLHVAQTIGTGIIEPAIVDAQVIFAALIGAIVWNLITWVAGIPSSSSHALIGGLVGGRHRQGRTFRRGLERAVENRAGHRAVAAGRASCSRWCWSRSSPGLRCARRRSRSIAPSASCSSPRPRSIRSAMAATTPRRPWASSRCCSIRRAISAANSACPFWVVLSCQAAMALGTLMGGWRIVRTMGLRITKLTPMQGFCAETGGAIDPVHGDLPRGSRLHHPHHYRRHRRRRRGAARLRRALERGQFDRLCLGHHDSGLGDRGRAGLLGGVGAPLSNPRRNFSRWNCGASSPYMRARGRIPPLIRPAFPGPNDARRLMSDLAVTTELPSRSPLSERSGAPAHLCDHLPSGRRQDHADRKAAAVRRRHQLRRPGQGQGRAAQHPLRLDEDRARARHLGGHLGDDLRVRGPGLQSSGHAGPRGLQRGHLSHADRGRFRGHGDRRRQGHRGAHAQAVRGLPSARHPDHHLHQQDGPREPRHLRSARRDREDAGARHHADDLAGRPRPRFPRHLRRRATAASVCSKAAAPRPVPRSRSRSPSSPSYNANLDIAPDQGRTRAGQGSLQAVRARGLPRRPSDAGLFRQRAAQFRRRRSARRARPLRAAAARAGIAICARSTPPSRA